MVKANNLIIVLVVAFVVFILFLSSDLGEERVFGEVDICDLGDDISLSDLDFPFSLVPGERHNFDPGVNVGFFRDVDPPFTITFVLEMVASEPVLFGSHTESTAVSFTESASTPLSGVDFGNEYFIMGDESVTFDFTYSYIAIWGNEDSSDCSNAVNGAIEVGRFVDTVMVGSTGTTLPNCDPGDLNCDGSISNSELLGAINEWADNVFSSSQLLNIINVWVNS